MTLRDVSTGPDWILWVVLIIFLLMTIALLTGHGAFLIAGYNTAGKQEKSKYNEKKLCRVTGAGLAVITVFIFVMAVWQDTLPASTAHIFAGVTFADCVIMIILGNTICRK